MKFTENNRISHRQLYRQMVLTFLAPFLLCLPGEGALAGREGVVGILAALPLLAAMCSFLCEWFPGIRIPSKISDRYREGWQDCSFCPMCF